MKKNQRIFQKKKVLKSELNFGSIVKAISLRTVAVIRNGALHPQVVRQLVLHT